MKDIYQNPKDGKVSIKRARNNKYYYVYIFILKHASCAYKSSYSISKALGLSMLLVFYKRLNRLVRLEHETNKKQNRSLTIFNKLFGEILSLLTFSIILYFH